MLLNRVQNTPPLRVGARVVVGALVPQTGAPALVDERVDLSGEIVG
jgi:hypothetical protein